jgi:tetratricopeptide (TPR) repeat protein
MRACVILWLAVASILAAGSVWGDPSPTPPGPAPAAPSPERFYSEGLKRNDYRRAVQAYEQAIRLREAYPEAWNGLGFALRQQGKYHEALRAYERALALQPDYAEALEYLGEALVRMGRLDDARSVLRRLEPLDPAEAGSSAR